MISPTNADKASYRMYGIPLFFALIVGGLAGNYLKFEIFLTMLHVCISDNGCGFDVIEAKKKTSKSGGFGLINVQRRIEHLGGSVIIESRPGNGTCAIIMAPLDIYH